MMRRERDETDRPLRLDRAERLDDPRRRDAEAAGAQRLDCDEVAVFSVARHGGGHEEIAARGTLLDGERAARAVLRFLEDRVDARLHLVEDLDDAARIGGLLAGGVRIELDPHEDARADGRRRSAVALRARAAYENAGRRSLFAPFGGPGDELAVAVALGDVGDDDRGQAALDLERLAAAADRALGLQVLDDELELRLRFALHPEGARDVALGDARRRLLAVRRGLAADEGDELLTRRQSGRDGGLGGAPYGGWFSQRIRLAGNRA